MNLTLNIDALKPIGLNNSYRLIRIGKRASRTKTTETLNFESMFSSRLDQYQPEIDKFNAIYDPLKHYLSASFRFYMPVFKKDGKSINMRSGDVDGLIKITQDCVFKKLKADDSGICSLAASKIHSDNYKIVVDITICDIKNIM